jgi:hypothetical protein
VRENEWRGDVPGELPEVPLVPGGLDAVKNGRRVLYAVPADAEPVAIGLLRTEGRVETLDDQRMLRLVEQVVEEDGRPRICKPAAHVSETRPARAGVASSARDDRW